MADFLLVLGVLALAALTTFVVAVALVMRKLTRANRVAPGRPSGAPLSWLVSPAAPPRMHRRLRAAVSTAALSSRIAPAAVTLGDVAIEITARAVAVDDWLVAARGLHRPVRRARLRQLAAEVRDIEACAGRLHSLSADWRRQLDEASRAMASPPDLHDRLDAVEAALRELPTATGTRAASPANSVPAVTVRSIR